MELIACTREEIEHIYNEYLIKDFPKDEVKPLSRILMLFDKNLYFAYGLYENNALTAYAFFSAAATSEFVLLDYLAVVNGNRGNGIGSAMLTLLKDAVCQNYAGIILESENPDFAQNKDDFSIRTRRIQFYLNNGFSTTKMVSRLFGVEYRIFVYAPKPPSTLSLAHATVDLYLTLIAEKHLKDNVSLRIEELF